MSRGGVERESLSADGSDSLGSKSGRAVKSAARIAVVQYRPRELSSFEEFARRCRYYAELAAGKETDFLVYPEFLTLELSCLLPPQQSTGNGRALDRFTDDYIELFSQLARSKSINIVGGTHLTVEQDKLYNIAYLFHRDGRIDRQKKLHITPDEKRWWGVEAGDDLEVFETDIGKVAMFICYDIEFPELARVAKAKGAELFIVPYNTELRSGHFRVRSCAQARTIENNVYLALSGMCGGAFTGGWSTHHHAQSAILTPCDISFARDGVGAEAEPNVEGLIFHDVDFSVLRKMQAQGQVRTWVDRRHDLYQLRWTGAGEPLDIE